MSTNNICFYEENQKNIVPLMKFSADLFAVLFVLRFYSPVNPMGSC